MFVAYSKIIVAYILSSPMPIRVFVAYSKIIVAYILSSPMSIRVFVAYSKIEQANRWLDVRFFMYVIIRYRVSKLLWTTS